MNRKVSIINDRVINGRNQSLTLLPILASFGDRGYVGINDSITYDAFITSYIKDEEYILKLRETIADAKLDNPKVLALVDPVFAKDGEKIEGISDVHIDNYKKLMEVSDIISPNITEACFLAGESFESYREKYCVINYENDNKDKVNELSKKLIETFIPLLEKIRMKKNQITIITGIELYNVILTILDVYDGDHGKRQTTCNYSEKIESRYGAGDIFDAMFFETSTNGFNLIDALSVSTSFINNSLRFSRDNKYDKNLGIVYEPILNDNITVMKQKLVKKENK